MKNLKGLFILSVLLLFVGNANAQNYYVGPRTISSTNYTANNTGVGVNCFNPGNRRLEYGSWFGMPRSFNNWRYKLRILFRALDTIRKLFPNNVFAQTISNYKDPEYGPFDSNAWSGGGKLIYVNPTFRQK